MKLSTGTLQLIERGHRFSPFYEDDLSNHLPMALAALDSLGASVTEIAAFADHYEKSLEALPAPVGEISDRTVSDFLGCRPAVASWIAFFDGRIASLGAMETTRLWLDRLMPGIGSVAFHGLLRLAYAVESGSNNELAHALAQWAAGYMTLGALPTFASDSTPEAALALLVGAKGRYPGGNIAARMQNVKADPDFTAAVANGGVKELTTAALARAVHSVYRATGNFTVLHAVTACHAFRLLAPQMRDPDQGRRYLWQALVCAYISAGGSKAGTRLKGDESLTWERIRSLAALAQDEHDIKLVYTCQCECECYDDDTYRRTASAYMSSRQNRS